MREGKLSSRLQRIIVGTSHTAAVVGAGNTGTVMLSGAERRSTLWAVLAQPSTMDPLSDAQRSLCRPIEQDSDDVAGGQSSHQFGCVIT